MRKLIFSTLALLFFTIVGCNKHKEEKLPNYEIKDFSYTECKPQTYNYYPKEYLELKSDNNYLKIKHINAEFNCCPKKLLINSKISNDTIFVYQNEKASMCKCVCRYDLNYKVGTLEHKKYHFVLNQMNSVLMEFDFDFDTKLNKVIDIPYKNH